MYKDDSLQMEDIAKLLQRFGNQTLDFFGAIRASTYDDQILCEHHRLHANIARNAACRGTGESP